MSKPTKGMISAAHAQLQGMKEMFDEIRSNEGNHEANASMQHARRSASNYIAVLKTAGLELPAWIVKDAKFLQTIGWSI